jgi:hypothetical protein
MTPTLSFGESLFNYSTTSFIENADEPIVTITLLASFGP